MRYLSLVKTVIAAVSVLLLSGCSHSVNETAQIGTIRLRDVLFVRIRHVPGNLSTIVRMRPEFVSSLYQEEVTLKSTDRVRDLFAAAADSIGGVASEPPDIRWQISFYGASSRELVSVYFDDAAKAGIIYGKNIRLKSGLSRWLNRNVSCIIAD